MIFKNLDGFLLPRATRQRIAICWLGFEAACSELDQRFADYAFSIGLGRLDGRRIRLQRLCRRRSTFGRLRKADPERMAPCSGRLVEAVRSSR